MSEPISKEEAARLSASNINDVISSMREAAAEEPEAFELDDLDTYVDDSAYDEEPED